MRSMKTRKGQAMILAVLSLGGAMLGATTIAGLLMLYQLREVSDSANSAKAILAADAGVEWSEYSYFNPPANSNSVFTLPGSNASYAVTCYNSSTPPGIVDCGSNPAYAVSRGQSLESARALYVTFSAATTSYP